MKKLRYYSIIPNNKPEWLLRLQMDISRYYGLGLMEDTEENWKRLKAYVDARMLDLHCARGVKIRSSIGSRLVTDNGRTVLHIRRNREVIQIYYLQEIENAESNQFPPLLCTAQEDAGSR
jgi:hypothetical protein